MLYFLLPLLPLLVVLAVGILFIRYRKDMAELLKKIYNESEVLSLPSGDCEYVIKGDGLPVIISHGGAGGYDQGLITARTHLDKRFKVVAVSRIGHLRSGLPEDASALKQADIYAELLDSLGINKAAIIGTSGGGPSAIQFAIRHPDRCSALVLSCAVSQYLPMRSMNVYKHPFMYWLIIKYLKQVVLKQIGVDKATYIKLSQSERDNLEKLFEVMNPIDHRRDGLFIEVKEWADHNMWKQKYDLSEIAVPSLIIHAVDDNVIPYAHAENAYNCINNAELLKLPNGGHLKLGHGLLVKTSTSDFIGKIL